MAATWTGQQRPGLQERSSASSDRDPLCGVTPCGLLSSDSETNPEKESTMERTQQQTDKAAEQAVFLTFEMADRVVAKVVQGKSVEVARATVRTEMQAETGLADATMDYLLSQADRAMVLQLEKALAMGPLEDGLLA